MCIRDSRGSDNVQSAKLQLIERFGLSDAQAQAIVDMRLRALTGLEREKLENEYKELMARIEQLKAILADRKVLLGVIRREILTVSENGMCKRTPLAEFTVQLRGGKGVKCYKITEKTGNLIGSKAVNEDNEIMMITTEGIIIRTPCSGISVMGRITSGVKLMDVDGEIKVASIAKVRDKEASEETSVSEKENETASEKTQE